MLAVVTFRAGVNLLFGISYERSKFWHGYFALLALAYGAWHGYVALFRDTGGDSGFPPRLSALSGDGQYQTQYCVTGTIALTSLALIIFSSPAPIRRFARRLWMHSHHVLALIAAVAAAIHGAGGAIAAGFGIIVLDRLFG
jgi:hypothetical protein